MMKQCKCGSWAINHRSHGRDGTDGDLCDVCYWRTRAEQANNDALRYRWLRDVGDATWRPFALREGYSADMADKAIDAAMLKTQNAGVTGAAPGKAVHAERKADEIERRKTAMELIELCRAD